MFAKCIALFLCLVGLPAIVVAVVGTVQNAANLENYVVDTTGTGGSWLPVQYSQNLVSGNNLATPDTTTRDPISNYFVLNPEYLGTDPLRSDLLRKQLLANSIVATNTQLPTTNQPPAPVQDLLPQEQSMPTPSPTPTTNSIQEPPKQSGGMTFTVSSGPGTNSQLQTFGNPPLIIFAPQNPTPTIGTTAATTSEIATVQPSEGTGNTNPTGSNTVNTPTVAPTVGTNTVNTPTVAPTVGTGTNNVANPVQPTTAQPTPVDPAPPSTPSDIRNPFGTNVPVTDPTFQFSGIPTIVSTLADPTKLNPIPEVATSSPTFNDLTPATVFELQTGMPWNQVLNQPTPDPEPQTTTPTLRNPFVTANVPPFLGNPAPIDPQVISSGTTTTGSTGSVIPTSIGSASTVGPISTNIGTATDTGTTSPTATGPGASNIPAQTTQETGTQAPGLPTATTTNVPATSNTAADLTNGTEVLNLTTGLFEVTNGTELFNATVLFEVTNGTELFNATGLTDLTNGTEMFNVTEVSPLGTNGTMNSTAAVNVSTTSAPLLVNPIDTILNLVANKTREPALQMSIDRQVGLFRKYLNQQTAYYQKSMDKLTALMEQVTQRNASTTAALTNLRGLLSGMITSPNQKVSLENLLRAATTVQSLKDQVALAQSQKSISKVRALIIDAARVANIGL